jgi:hypothetical protein
MWTLHASCLLIRKVRQRYLPEALVRIDRWTGLKYLLAFEKPTTTTPAPSSRPRAAELRSLVNGKDYGIGELLARRAAANPIGRNVKLAELADNCDLSRIAEPTEVDYQRIEKYQRAIRLIRAM